MNEQLRRTILGFFRRPRVTRVMSRVLPKVDRGVRKITGGRVRSTGQWLIPTMVLRSVGAKSGLPREHTLVYVRDAEGRPHLAGTNFGGENHPAWTNNLLAHPRATAEIDGSSHDVVAVPLTETEKAAMWPRFDEVYAGFASYRERIGDQREIRVFRLEPATPSAPGA